MSATTVQRWAIGDARITKVIELEATEAIVHELAGSTEGTFASRPTPWLEPMPPGKGQPSPAPSKRLNVSRTVEAAMPSRRAISRVEIPAENFKRMISRTWRIATLSAGIDRSLGMPKERP